MEQDGGAARKGNRFVPMIGIVTKCPFGAMTVGPGVIAPKGHFVANDGRSVVVKQSPSTTLPRAARLPSLWPQGGVPEAEG